MGVGMDPEIYIKGSSLSLPDLTPVCIFLGPVVVGKATNISIIYSMGS
jgi:hypothetical protein